jgi:hypothetical protein
MLGGFERVGMVGIVGIVGMVGCGIDKDCIWARLKAGLGAKVVVGPRCIAWA